MIEDGNKENGEEYMAQIIVGNTEIYYRVIRSRRKTIGIIIDPEKGVVVRVPERLTDKQIKEFVKKKSSWIIKKQEELKKVKCLPKAREFVSGEKLTYLGELYEIEVIQGEDNKSVEITLKDGKFQIRVSSSLKGDNRRETIIRELVQWYKKQARIKYKERVELYRNIMNVTYNKIYIRDQKTRWGSCSSKGNLNFNWRLIMAPLSIMDYIVVHELVHLVHPNHSKDFWKLVKKIVPDYKEKKEWLKIYGNSLSI